MRGCTFNSRERGAFQGDGDGMERSRGRWDKASER